VTYRVRRVPEEGTGSRGRWNHRTAAAIAKKLPERVSRRDPGGVTHKIGGDSVHAVGVGKGGSARRLPLQRMEAADLGRSRFSALANRLPSELFRKFGTL
jgi:hypothetical protein